MGRRPAPQGIIRVYHRKMPNGTAIWQHPLGIASVIACGGVRSNINMQLTRENDEVYYLGELNINGNEPINFEIVTQIEKQKPMRMTFFQEFFSQ